MIQVQLCKAAQQIFDFICWHYQENGYSPTAAEICKHTGITSRGTISHHMKTLRRAGYIKSEQPNIARGNVPNIPPNMFFVKRG